jgi:lipopolysaccharide/colanic/teichoic acid biosynthesis glycosyltransferase
MLQFMSRLQKIPAAQPRRKRFMSAFSEVIIRDRYQILVGLSLAVGIPLSARAAITGAHITQPTQYNTVVAATVAIIFGYISFRRIHVFPGITSGGYIATSLTLWFGLMSAIFVFFRLEYTTVQLFFGYVIALAYFVFINLYFVTRRTMLLGVIPSPATACLPMIRRVQWHMIADPQTKVPPLNGVVVDLHDTFSDDWSNRIAAFALEGVPVYHFKDAIENLLGQVEIEKLSENTLGSLNPNDVYLNIKSFADRLSAILVLIIIAPLLIVVAVAIRLDSAGPILFKQERVGFRKRTFTVYKFRTMICAPNDSRDCRTGAITRENDPRITRVGRFLRRYRIDELPQLVNIVRGEMSLIGPRPEALALAEWYEKEIPF